MEIKLNSVRIRSSPNPLVLSPTIPLRKNQSNINRRLKTLRKKTNSNVFTPLPANWMVGRMKVKQTVARVIRMAPFSAPGSCRLRKTGRPRDEMGERLTGRKQPTPATSTNALRNAWWDTDKRNSTSPYAKSGATPKEASVFFFTSSTVTFVANSVSIV